MLPEQQLPEPLPTEPMTLLAAWLEEATRRGDRPNPNAMVLATSVNDRPSARVVLCKELDAATGSVRFFSNYESRKGRELAANSHAALVFHWDHLHRQARLEGRVDRADPADSDTYFASRPRDSQIGAHASRQSQPLDSKDQLRAQVEAVRRQFGDGPVPRPAYWGGYVFWAEAVELWVAGTGRVHERARWTREISFSCGARPVAGPWTATRLQP
jgi:pyridoxamine 5'-phosphate oxidase